MKVNKIILGVLGATAAVGFVSGVIVKKVLDKKEEKFWDRFKDDDLEDEFEEDEFEEDDEVTIVDSQNETPEKCHCDSTKECTCGGHCEDDNCEHQLVMEFGADKKVAFVDKDAK